MYQLQKNLYTGELDIIVRWDGTVKYDIPFDPNNRDYAEYLRWLEEGNTPLPAEQPPTE